jgi:hypothetical protein
MVNEMTNNKIPQEIKEEMNTDLDGIYTSNKYWVINGKNISDGKFQEILEVFLNYLKSWYNKGFKAGQKQKEDECLKLLGFREEVGSKDGKEDFN